MTARRERRERDVDEPSLAEGVRSVPRREADNGTVEDADSREVDRTSMDSFPASDPPGWTSVTGVGHAHGRTTGADREG